MFRNQLGFATTCDYVMCDPFLSWLVNLWMHITNETKIAVVIPYGVYKYVLILSEMCRE